MVFALLFLAATASASGNQEALAAAAKAKAEKLLCKPSETKLAEACLCPTETAGNAKKATTAVTTFAGKPVADLAKPDTFTALQEELKGLTASCAAQATCTVAKGCVAGSGEKTPTDTTANSAMSYGIPAVALLMAFCF